jgi:hypothetical protein
MIVTFLLIGLKGAVLKTLPIEKYIGINPQSTNPGRPRWTGRQAMPASDEANNTLSNHIQRAHEKESAKRSPSRWLNFMAMACRSE